MSAVLEGRKKLKEGILNGQRKNIYLVMRGAGRRGKKENL